jgi:regulator of cell morphogenesis and NO signaling
MKLEQYLATSKMRDLLVDNQQLLMTLSRFGIALGFGDATVSDVCRHCGVDTNTFLAVANLISHKPYEHLKVSLPSLMRYLRRAHAYFLDFSLPSIRRKLIEAISTGNAGDISVFVVKFFDEYTEDVRAHMRYEDEKVFTHVDALLAGNGSANYSITHFGSTHHPLDAKIKELKEIFLFHYSAEEGARVDMLNAVLFDIITFEHDLENHCRVEDALFVPAVEHLESSVPSADEEQPAQGIGNVEADLTAREREIVGAIAHGWSNKEIADRMCVSVHTVTTHRRNICAKLGIHSPSGLTIYAILHGLVNIDEIRIN